MPTRVIPYWVLSWANDLEHILQPIFKVFVMVAAAIAIYLLAVSLFRHNKTKDDQS